MLVVVVVIVVVVPPGGVGVGDLPEAVGRPP